MLHRAEITLRSSVENITKKEISLRVSIWQKRVINRHYDSFDTLHTLIVTTTLYTRQPQNDTLHTTERHLAHGETTLYTQADL